MITAFDSVIDNLWRAAADDNANMVSVRAQVVITDCGRAIVHINQLVSGVGNGVILNYHRTVSAHPTLAYVPQDIVTDLSPIPGAKNAIVLHYSIGENAVIELKMIPVVDARSGAVRGDSDHLLWRAHRV